MPRLYDLYCGLGGWAAAFLAEGWEVFGFDLERHDYGTGGYPGQLVLQDVRTLHGAQLADADLIVSSSPCQEFSYRAMPWKRAKLLGPPVLGIDLFWQAFRIQHEASEAAGHEIPLVAENVKGAQKYIGSAAWHFGSFYLWGDVPALMPIRMGGRKSQHQPLIDTPPGTGKTSWFFGNSKHEGRYYGTEPLKDGMKNADGSWFAQAHNTESGHGKNPDGRKIPGQDWNNFAKTGETSPHWRMQAEAGIKVHGQKTGEEYAFTRGSTKGASGSWFGDPSKHGDPREASSYSLRSEAVKQNGSGAAWFDEGFTKFPSRSMRRKAASAQIAKIPPALAQHLA